MDNFESIVIEFFRFFLSNDIVFVQAVGCNYYDNCINETLIEKIEEIQFNISLSDEEKDTMLELLRLSPSAFSRSLYPEEVISGYYRQGLKDERVD